MDQEMMKYLNLKSPLLITGETGTGKSHLARELFKHSSIFKSKFVTAHLASLKEDLIESELFGHRKGAFTGALENKHGYLQGAQEGTLFLDEIGELSLESQKKLLYLLEEKKFNPVGSSVAIDFRGRIIMATNRNLLEMVRQKTFREDLYYRIKIFQIELRPIRDDQQRLSRHIEELFENLKRSHGLPYARLSTNAKNFLLNGHWKGNIRELAGVLEYALVMGLKNQIEVEDFPSNEAQVCESLVSESSFLERLPENFHQGMEHFEELFIKSALVKNRGRINETARKIGISKTTLIQKAKKYRINTLEIRAGNLDLAA